MRWLEDGKSFFIAKGELPKHLREHLEVDDYEKLQRRLYYFGFHKPPRSGWQHDDFIRGEPSFIGPARPMSQSPSFRSLSQTTQRGPRYKIVKPRRKRESA